MSARRCSKFSKQVTAISASGLRLPVKQERTAPAPIQSSIAGRSEPSPHPSPAGITAIREPYSRIRAATAAQLRRHAVKVTALSALSERVAPLGEGRTSATPGSIDSSEAGESEYPSLALRGEASTAPFEAANSSAELPFQGKGRTSAPLDTAISTAVENDKTSTITTTSLMGASCRIPCKPHSQRRSYSL